MKPNTIGPSSACDCLLLCLRELRRKYRCCRRKFDPV
jgi:hypothetical protein